MKVDERALTLVDKSTYELLLAKLYHTIVVDIAQWPQSAPIYQALTHSKHCAKQYIKRVVFDASQLKNKSRPPSGASRLATLFAEGLNFDQLEYFR